MSLWTTLIKVSSPLDPKTHQDTALLAHYPLAHTTNSLSFYLFGFWRYWGLNLGLTLARKHSTT
jgi:hypothetical protein